MRTSACRLMPIIGTTLLLVTAGPASAERARLRFVPTGPGGALQLVPVADGSPGERAGSFGKARGTICQPPQPTCNVPFKHACTCQQVIVPLALPEGTPDILHVRQNIVYNYGSYTVEVRFIPDGSVDVIYNSGLLRRIAFPASYSVPAIESAPFSPPTPLPPPRMLK